MIFREDGSRDGALVYGFEKGWHWSRDKGHYHKNRDFFWVHWEISKAKPNSVKFHIECPRIEAGAKLNAIKQDIVEDFLAVRFRDLAEQAGYKYKMGNRIKKEHKEKFKSTSAFHVLLTESQSKEDDRANIEMINALLRDEIQPIIERYQERLKAEGLTEDC